MAFGFLGDIVEGVADVFLPPKGTRGQTFGSAVGGAIGGPTGAAVGGVVGSGLSSGLSSATASGSKGQSAVSTPTVAQSPSAAPESAMSGGDYGPTVYRPQFTPRLPTPTRLPNQTRTTGADLMDLIPDLEISKFFGTGTCAQKMKKLVSVDKDGCPYVTRKQQMVLRKMLQYLPIEEVAYSAGVTTDDIARMVSKNFAPRRKGISAADMRTANRVNNQTLRNARKLGYNVTPMTKAELNKRGC